jgi:hypothetical protein
MTEPSHTYTYPKYSIPIVFLLELAWSALRGRRRSFRVDAQRLMAGVHPPLQAQGREHIPTDEPFVLTINHYARSGFGAWWLALAVSAQLEQEVRWMMTGAWTFPGRWYAGLLKPLSGWLFARLARVYGFTTTPPMPPDPVEAQARGESVRRVLEAARRNPHPVIGLSPEGRDFPDGALGWPPRGAGRFVHKLNRMGYPILPVGLYEQDGYFHLNFGHPYHLGEPHSHATGEIHPETYRLVTQWQIDLLLARTVMRRIAVLLPERLQGEFD